MENRTACTDGHNHNSEHVLSTKIHCSFYFDRSVVLYTCIYTYSLVLFFCALAYHVWMVLMSVLAKQTMDFQNHQHFAHNLCVIICRSSRRNKSTSVTLRVHICIYYEHGFSKQCFLCSLHTEPVGGLSAMLNSTLHVLRVHICIDVKIIIIYCHYYTAFSEQTGLPSL